MDPQNNTSSTGAFSPTRRHTLDLGGGPLSWTMMAPGVDGVWKHIMGLRKNTNNRLASSTHLLWDKFFQVLTPIRCPILLTAL